MIWPTDDAGIADMLLAHEGSEFTNDPLDAGGPTKFGITLPTLNAWRGGDVTVADLAALTRQEAAQIYQKMFISDPGFEQIANVCLRAALADATVLFGPQRVIDALQAIIVTTQDGIFGSRTVALANAHETRGVINRLSLWRIQAHIGRCVADPRQLKFLEGWYNRAAAFME